MFYFEIFFMYLCEITMFGVIAVIFLNLLVFFFIVIYFHN